MSVKDKKYYWLKLKRDFFKRHDIKIIESRPNGEKYVLFYMKLLVESIDHEGKLRFNDTIPYNDEMLATITNTDIDVVRTAVKLFNQLGMMDILEDGTIFMQEIQKMVGHETYWAVKKREERERKSLELEIVKPSQTSPSKSIEKEKELDKDKEKDKDIDKEKDKELKEARKYIIKHLNDILGRNIFKPNAEKNKRHIDARLKEGYTIEDFIRVINYKYWDWSNTEHAKFLRPETLFGNKFDGYLSASYTEEQKQINKQQQLKENLEFLDL